MKAKYLVADTAAFVKNVPLWEYGEEVLCVPEVIGEIRDKQTKQRVKALPIPITMRQPQTHSMHFVNEFSKKTGDYASLSLADMKLLALTYELEVEARGGSDHLRKEPQKIITEGNISQPTQQPGNTKAEDPGITEQEENHPVTVNGISSTQSTEEREFSLEDDTEDIRSSGRICHQYLLDLNTSLGDQSYITGHVPTTEDLVLLHALLQHYPQLSPTPNPNPDSTLPPGQNQNNPQFTPAQDQSSSMTGGSDCIHIASMYPHLHRWATHMMSYIDEQQALASCTEQQFLQFLATNMRDNEESDVCCPGKTEEDSTEGVEGKEGLESNATDEGVECVQEGEEEDENEAQKEDQEEGKGNDDDKARLESGEGSGEEEDDDDDDGWITPSNIKKHKVKAGLLEDEKEQEEEDVLVACMTVDFAMQNTLKHIGLSVMGIDGMLIRQIRTYILRCHACYHTTSVMTKIFCTHCGNKTLKKVSVTVNPDGSQKIWINYKKPINIRGTKFSLPTPKGGKHARNPLLVADQREAMHWSSKMSKKKVNPLHDDYCPDSSPFAVRDVYSRAAQLGYIGDKNHNHYYWERRNPNERQRRTGKKKK